MSFSYPVSVLIVCLAAVFIIRHAAVYFKLEFIRLTATPLVTYLICTIAAVGVYRCGDRAGWLILAALGISLVADTLLMVEKADVFVHGLLFFLAAHVLYIIVFSANYSFLVSDIACGGLLAAMLIFLVKRFRGEGNIGELTVPVIIYITVLSLTVFFSFNAAVLSPTRTNILRAAGSLCFYVSDAILGWNEFVRPVNNWNIYVWSFYAPGQFMFALSIY